jgi:hypothetical protein
VANSTVHSYTPASLITSENLPILPSSTGQCRFIGQQNFSVLALLLIINPIQSAKMPNQQNNTIIWYHEEKPVHTMSSSRSRLYVVQKPIHPTPVFASLPRTHAQGIPLIARLVTANASCLKRKSGAGACRLLDHF